MRGHSSFKSNSILFIPHEILIIAPSLHDYSHDRFSFCPETLSRFNLHRKIQMWNVKWLGTKKKIGVPDRNRTYFPFYFITELKIHHLYSLIATHDDFDSSVPCSMQDAWPCSPWFLVAQWIERPPGVWEVMGSIPARNSDFFFVPCLCHVDQSTFHISLPRSKFIIFIHLTSRNLFINSKQNQKMIVHCTLFRENDDLPLSISSRKEKAARALITRELMRRV